MIKLYNSLTKTKEEFKEIKKGEIKMYSCGPTVYNYVHIGNLRAFVFSDIVSRVFRYFNFDVNNVMNLTDIDDKTIIGSIKEYPEIKNPNKRLDIFTKKYSEAFFEDCIKLNILTPKYITKATQSIKEMELLISKLIKKKFAYISDDGIYYSLNKSKNYGQLVDIDFSSQKYNKENRVIKDEYEKESASDFALWKFRKENEPFWEITIEDKIYQGRPGWHIECSAMNYKIHGPSLDIHTGGDDLKFPHHENEIAQSECAFDCKYVNYWLHNGFLLVDGKKMSKSLNNFYTLRDLEKKGYNVFALREVFLRAHYRHPLNFTFESLKAGEVMIKKVNDFKFKFENITTSKESFTNVKNIYTSKLLEFEQAIKDDLNTPSALAVLNTFMNEINKIEIFSQEDVFLILEFLKKTDLILGLLFIEENIPKEIEKLALLRKKAREEKDWKTSDDLRDEILKLGYIIKDDKSVKNGFILNKK